METFWIEHSKNADMSDSLLDTSGEDISKDDMLELLEVLPDFTGMDVIDLGSAIGRYTGVFAQKARSVVSADLMETFVERNRQINGHLDNVKILCADAKTLNFPPNSLDLVFSNWLLMYFSESEIEEYFQKALSWLRPGGYLFFRESCFHPSGNIVESAKDNPTIYRDSAIYNALVQAACLPFHKSNASDVTIGMKDKNGASVNDNDVMGKTHSTFKILLWKSAKTYINRKKNRNQLYWLLQKSFCKTDVSACKNYKDFLNRQQHSLDALKRREWIFGLNFSSSGGLEAATNCAKMLELKKGESLLELGCEIGGFSFYALENQDVEIVAVDNDLDKISFAQEKAKKKECFKVHFELADITKRNYEDGTFDAVFTGNFLSKLDEKQQLLNNSFRWLRPGGRLLITDYCCREGTKDNWSKEFTDYVLRRGYHLIPISQYTKALNEAGFEKVTYVDMTEKRMREIKLELEKLSSVKEEFIKEAAEDEYGGLERELLELLDNLQSENLHHISIHAEKH